MIWCMLWATLPGAPCWPAPWLLACAKLSCQPARHHLLHRPAASRLHTGSGVAQHVHCKTLNMTNNVRYPCNVDMHAHIDAVTQPGESSRQIQGSERGRLLPTRAVCNTVQMTGGCSVVESVVCDCILDLLSVEHQICSTSECSPSPSGGKRDHVSFYHPILTMLPTWQGGGTSKHTTADGT